MTWLYGGLIALALLSLVIVVSACIVGGRADEAMDRLHRQRTEA